MISGFGRIPDLVQLVDLFLVRNLNHAVLAERCQMLAEAMVHNEHSISNGRSNLNGRVVDGAALACGSCLMPLS